MTSGLQTGSRWVQKISAPKKDRGARLFNTIISINKFSLQYLSFKGMLLLSYARMFKVYAQLI